jgi:poly [ADP-ribose] polymerase
VDLADDDDEEEVVVKPVKGKTAKKKKVRDCSLPKSTQKLIKLIFDNDMFKEALKEMKIDLDKMPLGKISKKQIAAGFEVLEEMEEVIKNGKKGNLNELSSKFYTLIPHAFGRQIPPAIKDAETLQQKMDLLEILGDIELAQRVQNEGEDDEDDEIDHPLDINYKKLNNTLTPVEKDSEEWEYIEKYVAATKPGGFKGQILDIFTLDRKGEKERFKKYKHLDNRRLLWHGTNVAVMVAILQTGLRIMPHSGGRVGRGIYFASEHAKSAGYVRTAASDEGQIGLMVLNEVALGKEYHITQDDSSLKAAPKGYDCVVAQGRQEPNPKDDIYVDGEFGKIRIAQGKPQDRNEYAKSSFWQSEYLVYDEAQNYMRYLIKFKWN